MWRDISQRRRSFIAVPHPIWKGGGAYSTAPVARGLRRATADPRHVAKVGRLPEASVTIGCVTVGLWQVTQSKPKGPRAAGLTTLLDTWKR